MRRIGALLALAVLATSCSNKDRYAVEFGAAETLTITNGPVVFALGPEGDIYFAELRTNDVFKLSGQEKRPVGRLLYQPDSLAVDSGGQLYAAGRDENQQTWVTSLSGRKTVSASGPPSEFPLHIVFTSKNEMVIGHGDTVVRRVNNAETVISKGWTDPVVTAGRGNKIWVADNAASGTKERVARGREKSVAKRNRFATALPASSDPSGMALVNDELLVCSRTRQQIYRLHIGLDEVARRRGWLKGLVCDRDIAIDRTGALITAANGAIYKYPPRR